MNVRAKFKYVSYTSQLSHGDKELRTLTFYPVTSNSEENKKFFEWTPSGKLDLGVLSQYAWGQFELGKEYYLDFTPADPAKS